MKPLTRDILLTLTLKLSLLIGLWFVCFKGAEKPAQEMHRWLLGSSLSQDTTQDIH
ncbi:MULTISPECIES: cytochrome oxidase putative small subunit CydP [Legionella]|uniref:cytochrome oxidase putative small subunit CydP n=1 Tax=Legionella TaxID=445 RepID=UPI00131535D0|nr:MULTISPECIES: cytochrome oxidase putative small subunit CydP [Legionella]MCP0914176.1 hypothetical protein [Legionella sp. 27cVA30]